MKNKILKYIAILVIGIGVILIYKNVKPFFHLGKKASTQDTSIALAAGQICNTVSVQAPKKQVVKKKKEPDYLVYPKEPKLNDIIGELTIPRMNLTLQIYEGTEKQQLDAGVGHFSGSVLPGQNDNVVLSGHNDTVFSGVQVLEKGDLLLIKNDMGKFTYQVSNTRIVDKDDKTVIVPTPKEVLTITTCYPFGYIGPAPERYIISADLVNMELTNSPS